jgi:hypothetical protein
LTPPSPLSTRLTRVDRSTKGRTKTVILNPLLVAPWL